VSSLVADIIMPIIAVLTGGINFTDFKIIIRKAVDELPGFQKAVPAVSLNWGSFLQASIDFLIIALCIFFVVKAMAKLQKPVEKTPEKPKGPSHEELLTEIRDLLKK
jgi:large conductance mechanosensitive channel